MTCGKCQGLMLLIEENLPESRLGGYMTRAWHCSNCGKAIPEPMPPFKYRDAGPGAKRGRRPGSGMYKRGASLPDLPFCAAANCENKTKVRRRLTCSYECQVERANFTRSQNKKKGVRNGRSRQTS